MTTELIENYSNIFEENDETSRSMLDSSRTTKTDDSLELFLAENIACYETARVLSVSSVSSSVMSNEGYTDSAAKETDTDNIDVDIPDDCRNASDG